MRQKSKINIQHWGARVFNTLIPRHRRPGSSVLDMALVLPILLALSFGTVEFGYYLFGQTVQFIYPVKQAVKKVFIRFRF